MLAEVRHSKVVENSAVKKQKIYDEKFAIAQCASINYGATFYGLKRPKYPAIIKQEWNILVDFEQGFILSCIDMIAEIYKL